MPRSTFPHVAPVPGMPRPASSTIAARRWRRAGASAHGRGMLRRLLLGLLTTSVLSCGGETPPASDAVESRAVRATAGDAASDAASRTTPAGSGTRLAAVPADTQRTVLAVSGMYCESCERTVSAMLRRTPGVVAAEVSAPRGRATVLFDSTRTSPAKLVEVLATLGYRATIATTQREAGERDAAPR